MNRARFRQVLAIVLLASGVLLVFTKLFSIDDSYMNTQAFMAPSNGNFMFAAILALESLLLAARFGLGYILLNDKACPVWLRTILIALLAVSGLSGMVLSIGIIILYFRNSNIEAHET